MRRPLTLTILAISAVGLSACAGKAPRSAGAMAPPGGSQTASGDYDSEGNYIGPGSQADLVRSAGSDRVFFDFDSSSLDNSDHETLRRQSAWLARYPDVSVTIEGHCDERGTREYNLALGERRANAAKNFLAASGVPAGRMQVVSYGKERPTMAGADESSWALNRRAVTVVIR